MYGPSVFPSRRLRLWPIVFIQEPFSGWVEHWLSALALSSPDGACLGDPHTLGCASSNLPRFSVFAMVFRPEFHLISGWYAKYYFLLFAFNLFQMIRWLSKPSRLPVFRDLANQVPVPPSLICHDYLKLYSSSLSSRPFTLKSPIFRSNSHVMHHFSHLSPALHQSFRFLGKFLCHVQDSQGSTYLEAGGEKTIYRKHEEIYYKSKFSL